MEHLSARVLSTTTDEDQTKKENPIKLVTGGIRQGNQVGGSLDKGATGENVNGEAAIDVDDNDGKLATSTSVSTQDPEIKVGDKLCFCCFICFCVHFLFVLLPHSFRSYK